MATIPLTPRQKQYRGGDERKMRKVADFNKAARRVADYVNRLMADDPNETQQYRFAEIAHHLELSVDDVREAISDGGYNGITLRVSSEARAALDEQYKRLLKS